LSEYISEAPAELLMSNESMLNELDYAKTAVRFKYDRFEN